MIFPPWWGYGYFLELHNSGFIPEEDDGSMEAL